MSSELEPGSASQYVLGRYRMVRRLAKGGMGVVYLGRLEGAAGFAKPVVIKRILQDAEERSENTARFIREAQILSNLQHPGIVGVLDFGEEAEGHAMILEYVHGYDLGRWLKYLQLSSRRMHWEEAVFILLRVLDALSYAHGLTRSDGSPAQVLHRDISPGNVLIDVDGRVRLLDFGIARMEEDDQYRTQTGILKGKLPFLAPELFASDPPSAASDIYACGVVLYQMLTGTHPFAGDNDSKLMWRIITDAPKPLREWVSDLPAALEAPILAALDKDPYRRHESAERFALELRQVLLRRESDIQNALREHVQADFNGEMPSVLRLDSLADRDRAWRQTRASQPPALIESLAELPSVTVRAHLARTSQPTETEGVSATLISDSPTERTRQAALQADSEPQPAEPAPAAAAPIVVRSAPERSDLRSMLGLGVGVGLVVLALLVVVTHWVGRREPAPTPARFIVVGSPDKPEGSRTAPASASESATTARGPVPGADDPAARAEHAGAPEHPAATSHVAPAGSRSSEKTDASALSQRFARREGALQSCFERYASGLSGAPRIAIHFQVSANGKVQGATVEPASLEATPLGGCLLEVARGTAFGQLGKPLLFTIPIRARSVTR